MRTLFAVCMGMIFATGAYAEDITPFSPLPPQPVNVPTMPQEGTGPVGEPEDDLAARLRQLIADREARIIAILDTNDGGLPTADARKLPETDEARLERDEAWRLLDKALAEQTEEVRRTTTDVLDKPANMETDEELLALKAKNRFDIARSYKALLEREELLDLAEVRTGHASAHDIEMSRLAEQERNQAIYLRLWFNLQLAAIVPDPERSRLMTNARSELETLRLTRPDSSLITSGADLLRNMQAQLERSNDGDAQL